MTDINDGLPSEGTVKLLIWVLVGFGAMGAAFWMIATPDQPAGPVAVAIAFIVSA